MTDFATRAQRGTQYIRQERIRAHDTQLNRAYLATDAEDDRSQGPSHIWLDAENMYGKFKTLFNEIPLHEGFDNAVDVLFNRMVVHGVCDMSEFYGADDPIVGYEAVQYSNITQTYQELYQAAFKKFRQQFPRNEQPSTLSEVLNAGMLARLGY